MTSQRRKGDCNAIVVQQACADCQGTDLLVGMCDNHVHILCADCGSEWFAFLLERRGLAAVN